MKFIRIKNIGRVFNRRTISSAAFFYLFIGTLLKGRYVAISFLSDFFNHYQTQMLVIVLPLCFLGLIIWDYRQQKFKEGLKMVVIISVLSIVGLLVFFSVGALT